MNRSNIALASVIVLAANGMVRADSPNDYTQTNLVADNSSFDPQIVDPNMTDAWGIALRPPGAGGHIWVDNATSGTVSEYIGDVNGIPLHQDGLTNVPISAPQFTDHGYAFVTGLAYNSGSDLPGQAEEFPVSGNAHNDSTTPPTNLGTVSGSAKFVFVTEDGCLNAWLSNTATAMDTAPIVVNYSKTASYFPYAANSVFSGVAMTNNPVTASQVGTAAGNHVYATDFRNNAVEVFNDQWADVTSSYSFTPPTDVSSSLHAFNAAVMGTNLYVAYAEFDPAGDEGMEQLNGPGEGRVVEYSLTGTYERTFGDGGEMNAPWGMVMAPSTFGAVGGDLLVGNFGDGTIDAYNPTTGAFVDELRGSDGNPLSIDGLWGMTFGNGVSLGDSNSLYFTAGPNSENDGLFGKLTVVPEPASLGLSAAACFLFLSRRRRV